jgi:hypothetical protein
MPLNPAIVRAARETQATAYVPPPAGAQPAWAVALALGTPLLCILIIAVGLVLRELRATRRDRGVQRPKLCPDCRGWGCARDGSLARCPTCEGKGYAP